MTSFKYLQKLFFLLVMVSSFALVCACSEDEENELYAENEPTEPDNGVIEEKYEAVDLGLPSGTMWATCNVGASFPEDFGEFYAWGEIETKGDYKWKTYKWCKGTEYSMTKYCTESYYGTVDSCSILTPSDDVATVKWGEKWHIPTIYQIEELFLFCSWTWTEQNGVKGYFVLGPSNESIFLPAAGIRYGTDFYLRGAYGCYCSTSLHELYGYNSYYLGFESGSYGFGSDNRCYGFSVRPVTDGLLSDNEK